MKSIYLLIISLLILSCKSEDIEIANLRINHYKQSAIGQAPTLVYLTQEGDNIGSDDWLFLYSDIEGFDYEWGFVYDLKIEKQTINNPPADASSVKLILKEVISKKMTDQNIAFKIQLKSSRSGISGIVEKSNSLEYVLLNQQKIECSDLCTELEKALSEQENLTGVFLHTSSGKIKLEELLPE